MPVITVESGKLATEQKEALIRELTQTASQIMKIPEQAYVVLLNEYDYDNIGNSGKMLSKLLAARDPLA
jgi:4-oxalocrotonate tautomerase